MDDQNPNQNNTENTSNNSTQPMSDDEAINLFIEGLIAEKGVDAPTEEIHQAVHADLKTQLMAELDRALVSALPDDKLEELYKITESSDKAVDPNLVAQYISDSGVDATSVIGNTIKQFGEAYLGRPLDNTETVPSEQGA